jgi:hypothetical protein
MGLHSWPAQTGQKQPVGLPKRPLKSGQPPNTWRPPPAPATRTLEVILGSEIERHTPSSEMAEASAERVTEYGAFWQPGMLAC